MAEKEREAGRAVMHALGMRHAMLEAEGDLDGTMATLIDEPIYEFWPAGRRMVGRDAVRKYYAHLIDDFMPRQIGYEMVSETMSEKALAQEYVIELRGPNGTERHRVLGILIADPQGRGLLEGERIWGHEDLLRLMVGPAWDDLERIEG